MALIAKHARKRAERGEASFTMDGGVVNELIADAHRRVG